MDLSKGDLFFLHSDLSPMAKGGWREAGQRLLRAIQEQMGPKGTLIAPTFTYSFCHGTPYCHESSPGEVGLFGNYLLAQPGAVRSFHPIFSCALLGPRARELCAALSRSAFGDGSLFQRLQLAGGKLLFFNAPFQACTFVHSVEQRIGVDYRSSKEFTGWVSVEGERSWSSWEFYARDLDRDVVTDLKALEQRLRDSGELTVGSLLGAPTLLVAAAAVDRQIALGLQTDPYFLLHHAPKEALCHGPDKK